MTWVPRPPLSGPFGTSTTGDGELSGPEPRGLDDTPAARSPEVEGGSTAPMSGIDPESSVRDRGDTGTGRFRVAGGTPTVPSGPISLQGGGTTTGHPGGGRGGTGFAPGADAGPVYTPPGPYGEFVGGVDVPRGGLADIDVDHPGRVRVGGRAGHFGGGGGLGPVFAPPPLGHLATPAASVSGGGAAGDLGLRPVHRVSSHADRPLARLFRGWGVDRGLGPASTILSGVGSYRLAGAVLQQAPGAAPVPGASDELNDAVDGVGDKIRELIDSAPDDWPKAPPGVDPYAHWRWLWQQWAKHINDTIVVMIFGKRIYDAIRDLFKKDKITVPDVEEGLSTASSISRSIAALIHNWSLCHTPSLTMGGNNSTFELGKQIARAFGAKEGSRLEASIGAYLALPLFNLVTRPPKQTGDEDDPPDDYAEIVSIELERLANGDPPSPAPSSASNPAPVVPITPGEAAASAEQLRQIYLAGGPAPPDFPPRPQTPPPTASRERQEAWAAAFDRWTERCREINDRWRRDLQRWESRGRPPRRHPAPREPRIPSETRPGAPHLPGTATR